MASSARPSRIDAVDIVDVVLLIVAAQQMLLGLFALIAPGAFYETIAPYPPDNAHFLKDVGSWQVALGAAALYAVRRPAWRTPMLAILALQYGLHAISHAIDVDRPDPAWQGPVSLGLLVAATLVLAALLVRERRR